MNDGPICHESCYTIKRMRPRRPIGIYSFWSFGNADSSLRFGSWYWTYNSPPLTITIGIARNLKIIPSWIVKQCSHLYINQTPGWIILRYSKAQSHQPCFPWLWIENVAAAHSTRRRNMRPCHGCCWYQRRCCHIFVAIVVIIFVVRWIRNNILHHGTLVIRSIAMTTMFHQIGMTLSMPSLQDTTSYFRFTLSSPLSLQRFNFLGFRGGHNW